MSVAIVATLITVHPNLANAETTPPAKEGLQIGPSLINLDGVRGKTYKVSVKVTNVTVDDQTYYTSVEDFTNKDESGTPNILLDSTLPDTVSIRSWVSTDPQINLKPGEVDTLTVNITIPSNAEAGGHYGALLFSGTASTPQSAGVAQSASAAALFLVTVEGTINESATLASFYTAPTSNDNESSFFEKTPITFVTRIKNDGNVHTQPSGHILIHDMFGNLTATLAVNDQKANVLPGSVRRFDMTLANSFLFGYYTADLGLSYGIHGQAITSTISFWVIPYKLVAVVLIAAATVIYILIRLVKVYNKHIITKAIQKNDQKTTKAKSAKK